MKKVFKSLVVLFGIVVVALGFNSKPKAETTKVSIDDVKIDKHGVIDIDVSISEFEVKEQLTADICCNCVTCQKC